MDFRPSQVPLVPPEAKLRPFDLDLIRMLDAQSSNLSAMFDKGISLSENVDAQILEYTTSATPDTEESVAHTLKRVPEGYIVVSVDKAGIIYQSGAFTTTALLLKCNAASVAVKLIVF